MAYRNKTYVAFDGDNDMHYYRLMQAWKQNDNTNFNFYDAHDLNNARDSSSENTIKLKLRERMRNSKIFVLLIGNNTKFLHKFVRWEIELALKINLPIICVNLNGSKKKDAYCPAILTGKLAVFIPYKPAIMQYSLEKWIQWHEKYSSEGKSTDYFFNDDVYKQLSL